MLDIGGTVSEVTLDLLKSMMGLEAVEGALGDLPGDPEKTEVVSFIGFSGSTSGTVGVYASAPLARRMIGALLGAEPEDVNEEVRDGFGEVANIIAGNVVTALCDTGEMLQLALPSVIVGKCLVTSILNTVPPRRARRFSVDGEDLYVELALRRDED
jgi:chemotaxis protein CheX